MTTNAFALIDRKTKKMVWIGLKKPNHQDGVHLKSSGPRLWTLDFCDCIEYEKHDLIPVTITPKPKKKR